MRMGRPRTQRKDLPPGLHVDKWGTYYFRATRGGRREYIAIGKVQREEAIKRWVEITNRVLINDSAAGGTVGELIDRFLRELDGVSAKTRVNYEFHCRKLRERWGDRKYAVTADEAARGGAIRALDISTYVREARKAGRGAVSAGYAIGVLSQVYGRARECGLTEYNPCTGVPRPHAKKLTQLPTFEEILAAQAKAKPRLALMIEMGWRTGMRQTDIRQMQVQQIGEDLRLVQSKTGMEQRWTISPELRRLLDAAAKLPGRRHSMFVFPLRTGEAMSEKGFQTEWRSLGVNFTFRALRKWAINQVIAAGRNGTDFAGHFDAATTRRHYDLTIKRVAPL